MVWSWFLVVFSGCRGFGRVSVPLLPPLCRWSDSESEFSAARKLADLCGSELSAAQRGNLLTFVDRS